VEARRVGERLETFLEDHGEAPGREEGADMLGVPEAIRKLARSTPKQGSARDPLRALT